MGAWVLQDLGSKRGLYLALAAVYAELGRDNVVIESATAVWPAGTEVFDGSGKPDPSRGFHTGEGGRLRVVGFPPLFLTTTVRKADEHASISITTRSTSPRLRIWSSSSPSPRRRARGGRTRSSDLLDAVPRLEHRGADGNAPRFAFVQTVPAPFARLLEPVDAQAAASLQLVRALAGDGVVPTRVVLSRPRPEEPREHERFYRCAIVWDAPAIDVELDAALLDVALPRSDPRLFGYLARRAEALSATLPEHATFADRARRAIGELLAQTEPTLGAVAQRLALSERTLHRRLADQGTGFAALRDDARRERALVLLEDEQLSASEIAFLLGYREPSAFFRAFRRWTGETPRAFRKKR